MVAHSERGEWACRSRHSVAISLAGRPRNLSTSMKADSGLTPGGAVEAVEVLDVVDACGDAVDGWGGGGVVNGGGTDGAWDLDCAGDFSRKTRFNSSTSLTPIL